MVKESRWEMHYRAAKERCENKNHKFYHRYGGRGIKFLLSKEDVKSIFFRDGANNMKRSSLDKINNDGNYTLKNSRFIECDLNAKLRPKNSKCKNNHNYSPDNTYINKNDKYKSRRCISCARESRLKYNRRNGL